jgi:replicative DNA helicase
MSKQDILDQAKNKEISPKEALDKVLKHSSRLSEIPLNLSSKPLVCGFPTIERYEYLLSGEGNLVIMAARPGNGKTSFACQLGLNVSGHSRVLMFSLEMKKETLKKRLLSVLSRVPIKKLGHPAFASRVKRAEDDLDLYRFDIIDKSGLNIHDIITRVHDENSREKVSMVIIDYIGMIQVSKDSRAQSIAEVARRLKDDLADKFKIPVIVLAQMNRDFDSRKVAASKDNEVRPTLADIGESSGIEHAADVVMFLHRPCLYDQASPPSLFKVYVAKNRNGEVKDFSLEFIDELTKFVDSGGF